MDNGALRGVGAAGRGIGSLRSVGALLRGASCGQLGAQIGQRDRRRRGSDQRLHGDAALVNRALQRLRINGLAGGRCNQQAQQRVGEIRARGEVQRGCVLVSLGFRQAAVCAAARGKLRVLRAALHGLRILRGLHRLTGGADEADDFLGGQPAVGQQAHEQRAVLLRLGGEERAAIRGRARGEQRQQVGHRLRVAGDFLALLAEQHHVAAAVNQHGAGMGGIAVADAHARQTVELLCAHGDAALRAGHSLVREGDAGNPRAGAAHADDAPAVGGDRQIQVIRPRRAGIGGGEVQPRARAAGHDGGQRAERIVRPCGERIEQPQGGAADLAGERQRQAVSAAQSVHHGARIPGGKALRACLSGGGQRGGRGLAGDGHGIELPVAGRAPLRQSERRQREQHGEREKSCDVFHQKKPPCQAKSV